MPKLFNYTFTCKFTVTYTTATLEEALERLTDDEGDVEVIDTDCEDFDPDLDDYMSGR